MRTSSRNVAVLLFDEVELLDVAGFMHVAAAAGRHWNWRPFRLLPTAATPGCIETRSQLRVEAPLALEVCPAPEVLFVPGGYGARRAARDARVLGFVAAAARTAELLLGVGAGVAVLGAAGVIDGCEVAVAPEHREWLVEALPRSSCIEAEGVLSSGKLLSAPGTGAALDLGFAMVERCLGARSAAQLRERLGLRAAPRRIEIRDTLQIALPKRES